MMAGRFQFYDRVPLGGAKILDCTCGERAHGRIERYDAQHPNRARGSRDSIDSRSPRAVYMDRISGVSRSQLDLATVDGNDARRSYMDRMSEAHRENR